MNIASDLKSINPVDLKTMCKLILAWTSGQQMNFPLSELKRDVDFVNWNEMQEIFINKKKRREGELTTFNIE